MWWTFLATLTIFLVTGIATAITVCQIEKSDPAAWFSAIGTTLAIAVGLVIAVLQLRHSARAEVQRRADLVVAAYDLAHEALTLVTGRLDVALSPRQPGSRLELREHRTTDTAMALREIEPHAIPPQVLKDFIQVRSRIYAINVRVSEVYSDREHAKEEWNRNHANIGQRRPAFNMSKKLAGAASVHAMTMEAYSELGKSGLPFGVIPKPINVPTSIQSHPAWIQTSATTGTGSGPFPQATSTTP